MSLIAVLRRRDADREARVKITMTGSRYFGAAAFEALHTDGVDIARVVVPDAEDRLANAARAAGIEVVVLEDPHIVPASAIDWRTTDNRAGSRKTLQKARKRR